MPCNDSKCLTRDSSPVRPFKVRCVCLKSVVKLFVVSIFNDEMEAVTYCLGLNVPVEKRDFSTLPIEERWGYTQEDQVFVNRILGLDSDNNNLVATHIEGFKNVEIIESIYDQIGLDR